ADSVGVVFWKDGNLFSVSRPVAPGQDRIEAALCALALGPTPEEQANGVRSAIPTGTMVLAVSVEDQSVGVDFSREIIGPDFGDAALEAIFTQVRYTLQVNGITANVRMTAEGARLASFLPPKPVIAPRQEPPRYAAGGALSGRKITISPGHGYVWQGTQWNWQRGITCASTGLAREDDHNLEICQYLEQYLLADGATVKMCRCTDKNYGTHTGTGKPWWQMAACYWLKNMGYPCSVYGSSTGCTLESGSSEWNDDIRARPLSSDYDASDIFISLHTNALSGDCYGSCPTGSDVFYDCSPEHAAWCNVSRSLEQAVYPAMLDAIRTGIPDPTWNNHGVWEDTQGNYGEIRIPDRAAILIELGYHDTCDRDALRLADNFFRSAAMWGIYKGVCDYFGVSPTYGFYSSELVSHDIPTTMAPGSVRTVHITFRNRGVLWNQARGFKLGAVGDSDPFTTTIRHDVPAEIGPSQTCTFTFDLTAPAVTGTYVTDWRMLREGYQWFGAICSQTIQVSGTADTTPPSVPTNLAGYAPSQTEVNLTWSPSTDNVAVAYYRVYRGGSPIGTSPSASYTDSTCSANTTYSYSVSAVDTSGNESAQCAPINITTPPYIEIIIDEEAATTSGAWSVSTGAGSAAWNGDYKWTSSATSETAWAKWIPTLPRAGNWAVSIFYRQGTNRSVRAPYTIYYDGGAQTFEINQTTNGGQWNYLATKPFLAGNSGYVKLGNGTRETSTVVIADAVKF
ncbi:MAG: N-acetylmuramoyl-L-alanine amidase, partial [Armatimonadota bacterium]